MINNYTQSKCSKTDCKKTGAGLDHNFGLRTFLIEGSFTTILDNYQIHLVNLFKPHLKNVRNNQDWTELLIIYYVYYIFSMLYFMVRLIQKFQLTLTQLLEERAPLRCWIWQLVRLLDFTVLWVGMVALGTVASEHFTGLAKLALPLICITIGMPAFLLETIWFFFHFGSLAGSGHIYKTVC